MSGLRFADEPIQISHPLAGALLIIALAALIYLPSMHGAFILDDDRCVVDNPNIFAPDGLHRIWFSTKQIEYYPISYSAFWLQWRLWGLNPIGYRITNLILHIATALLLWLVLRKLSIPGAFLASLLFAIHPLNVESVAWVFQCRGLLAMLFGLLSIVCYLKTDPRLLETPEQLNSPTRQSQRSFLSATWGWYALSLLAFVVAMLSKSSVATLPAILLLMVWWKDRIRIWDLVRTAPFFLVAAVLIRYNLWLQTQFLLVLRPAGFYERLAGAGAVVWFYLSYTLLPINLSFTYPQWQIRAADLLWWLPLLAAASVTFALFRQRHGSWGRAALFAWVFFCMALAPVLGLTDSGAFGISVVWDHYAHLAILGAISLAAAGWGYWYGWTMGSARYAPLILAFLLVSALALLTWQQNCLYADPIKLYQATLARNPDSWLAHNNLAEALNVANRSPEALHQAEEALRLKPDLPEAFYNMGNAQMQLFHLQQAIESYQQAVRFKPDYAKVHFSLGNALFKSDRRKEAIQHFELAMQFKPYDSNSHVNLAVALATENRMQEAVQQYQQALQLKPDNFFALANLALAFAALNRPQEAVDTAQKALDLARSQGETALAEQIQDWLSKYPGNPGVKK